MLPFSLVTEIAPARRRTLTALGLQQAALTILAAVLVGAYAALAVLFILTVLRAVRPRLDGHR